MKILVKSPGRINLIGEHTDYNGGYVLPCALNLSIEFSIEKKSKDSFVKTDLGYSMNFNVNSPFVKSPVHWENYVLGVVNELKQIKKNLTNFSCEIKSSLPSGAGISSSSALVCGLIKGLSALNNLSLDNTEVIEISRNVEHKYIGLLGGIMDQYTILNAKKNKVILLNCDNLKTEFIDIDFGQYEILLFDTNVKHNLANTEYNIRVNECHQALDIINTSNKKQYKNLSQASIDEINKAKNDLNENQYKRSVFVFEENQRTIKSAQLISKNNLIEFGKLMYQSHEGLKEKYEVSCKELDFLVELTKLFDGILGSRMMGGGFGGCTVNLIRNEKLDDVVTKIKKKYRANFGIDLNAIIAKPGSGIKINKL